MRRLITALASLAVVSLLIPSIGLAIEAPVENGVGILCIFTSEDLAAASNVIETVAPFTPYNLYFVLYNEQLTSNNLGGMTFKWRMDPVPSPAPVLTLALPPNTVNIGDSYNMILGFGSGLMTTDNHVLVASASVLFLNPAPSVPTYFYLAAADPTISGSNKMEYNDFTNPGTVLTADPNSVDGLYENPVFGLNMTIATETETWGGVKSLFR